MFSFFKKKQKRQVEKPSASPHLFPNIKENVTFICDAFNHTDDLQIRNITWNAKQGKLVYLETMTDMEHFQQTFLLPLSHSSKEEGQQTVDILASPEVQKSSDLQEVIENLLTGHCVLFLPQTSECIIFNSVQSNNRSPDEPENEKAIRGSHKGFVESLDTNLNLVRERVHNEHLTVKYFTLGNETSTNVAMLYMSNIADPAIHQSVQKRLESISSDIIFSPGYIEEAIEDHPYSPFQQLLVTERPDRVEANIIEGRVAIMVEGSADATIVPVTFFTFFQSTDDYNIRYYAGSFFRLLRIFSFLGALFLPAIYIAVVGFHFEVIPYDMISIVKSSVENIPFPPFVEALIMTVTIELIREAGIRLPTPIGQTIGIVGGLIIGDAVVSAGLISNIMVIVIALTAIMSFCLPSYEMGNTVRLLSVPVMLGAATLGFVGIVFASMLIIIHMCTLESFKTPYLSPLAPVHFEEFKDTLIRVPNWLINKRPKDIHPQKIMTGKKPRK